MLIAIEDDFDLNKIAVSGQCFRWERLAAGSYRIIHGSQCLHITEAGENRYDLDCSEADYERVWRDYFDLPENYASMRGRIDRRHDSFLWNAAEHEKGIRILRQDPWETLVSFIISQNKNIPAIQRSIRLLAERCGEAKTDQQGKTYYAFPTPEGILSLSESDLRECGLGYRCAYARAAARAVAEGQIDLNALKTAGEEKTIAELMKLYGVGVKVANCVSLFGLHHIDAFPQDVWIKRILCSEYPNGYPFETYAPYNGVYQQYMFAYYRHLENKKA